MEKDFYIKNMVCNRCIKVLKNEIEAQKIELVDIELGRVKLNIKDDEELEKFKKIIQTNGFELINSTEEKLIEQVKILLITILDKLPISLKENLSTYLSEKLHQEYSKISKVFSTTEDTTIEKYFIKLKIEKVKELIQANQHNFTEMAHLLDYSHINHLSSQFKSETGMSLSQYKTHQENNRKTLDEII
jgi:AraC-like DNA-binding protein